MSWVPPNLAASCAAPNNNITSCQPQTFLFLQIVAQMFGYSVDAPNSLPQFNQLQGILQSGLDNLLNQKTQQLGILQSSLNSLFNQQSQQQEILQSGLNSLINQQSQQQGILQSGLNSLINQQSQQQGILQSGLNSLFNQQSQQQGIPPSGMNFQFNQQSQQQAIPQSGFMFSNNYFQFNQQSQQQGIQEYDFIIIGAGSAGCVLANRLTEVFKWRVLLLEAGGEEPEVADVPAFAPTVQASSIDWNFSTQPDPNSCLARQNGQCTWARGRVMGGSSVLNYMIYIRGNPIDYDEWSNMGNYGWSYKEVLPYFIKSENNLNIQNVAPFVHGVGGPLSVQQFPYQDQNVIAMISAFQEAGLPYIDQNSGRQLGVTLLQTTSLNGKRVSANVAFIRPIRRIRKNLVIETNAYVLRVLINPQTKTAYGVEYSRNGQMIQAFARKEVIVSAGAIMSPKVLMLSGIGPAQHLQSFNIPVIQNLQVGYNLMDHPTLDNVLFQVSNVTATSETLEQEVQDMRYYQEEQNGPLASTGPLQVSAFVQTKYETQPGRPDIQYNIDSGNVADIIKNPILASSTKVAPLSYYDTLIIRPVLLNQQSRGVIKLNRTDPLYGYPIIYANYMSQQIDVLRIVEGIKQIMNLLKTPTLQKLGYRLVTTPMPACNQFVFGTDQYWACLVRAYTNTIYHFTGTCKMGPQFDRTSVVDPELRVHGISNLRVIDSSIMPRIVRGNTNAPTIMIAEKGSDLIKATWLNKNVKLGFKQMLKSFIRNKYF